MQTLKSWVKQSPHPVARFLCRLHAKRRALEIPKQITWLYKPLFILDRVFKETFFNMVHFFYWTPLFKSRVAGSAKRLTLYGGLPLITGPLEIALGDDCRLSGATTFSARTTAPEKPQLIIGNNVGIGWQTTIAVGNYVILQDNVRLGGRNFLAGYPGHPLDAEDRATGLPDTPDQVGDIILEQDVWLGTGVMVMAGVRIGQGTIVGAGSVVTKSLPAHVLAAGNPARVIRPLKSAKLEVAQ